VANKSACTQKGRGDGGLRWQKRMRGALKPFQLLQSLGVFNYCQVWALLSVIDLLHDAPSYLNDNNILSEMLMGDKTSTW
jgi:hypothetical protein